MCVREKNRFPSQPEVNPKFPLNQRPHDNVNAVVSLRSGKQVNSQVGNNSHEEEEPTSKPSHPLSNPNIEKLESSKAHDSTSEPISKPIFEDPIERVYKPKAPYP